MISIILYVGFFIKVIPARIKRLDTVPIRPNPTESRPKLSPEFFFRRLLGVCPEFARADLEKTQSKRRVDIKLIQSVNPDEE